MSTLVIVDQPASGERTVSSPIRDPWQSATAGCSRDQTYRAALGGGRGVVRESAWVFLGGGVGGKRKNTKVEDRSGHVKG